jgi:hypothetical protein
LELTNNDPNKNPSSSKNHKYNHQKHWKDRYTFRYKIHESTIKTHFKICIKDRQKKIMHNEPMLLSSFFFVSQMWQVVY